MGALPNLFSRVLGHKSVADRAPRVWRHLIAWIRAFDGEVNRDLCVAKIVSHGSPEQLLGLLAQASAAAKASVCVQLKAELAPWAVIPIRTPALCFYVRVLVADWTFHQVTPGAPTAQNYSSAASAAA